jgi:hypothetical protein
MSEKVGEQNGTNAMVPVEKGSVKDIIPFEKVASADISVLMGNEEIPQRFWTSADIKDPFWKMVVYRSLQGQDMKAADIKDAIFLTMNIVAQDVNLVDEKSGELIPATRCVLLDPEGVSLAFVSEGIRKSLRFLMGLYGSPPWKTPLPLKLKMNKRRGAGVYYTLDVDAAEMAKMMPPDPKRRAR